MFLKLRFNINLPSEEHLRLKHVNVDEAGLLLLEASSKNNVSLIKILSEKIFDIDSKNEHGETILMKASQNG